jgi:hypothetical protein
VPMKPQPPVIKNLFFDKIVIQIKVISYDNMILIKKKVFGINFGIIKK